MFFSPIGTTDDPPGIDCKDQESSGIISRSSCPVTIIVPYRREPVLPSENFVGGVDFYHFQSSSG